MSSTLICHDFLTKYFLICTQNTEIKVSDDISRPRYHEHWTTNVSPINIMSSQSTKYTSMQQYLVSRLRFFKAFMTTVLQFHAYKSIVTIDLSEVTYCFYSLARQSRARLVYCCEEVSLSVVDHWWWLSITSGPMLCTCKSCSFFLSFRNLLRRCNVNPKISIPFFITLEFGLCEVDFSHKKLL